MPATSPSEASISSVFQPRDSQNRRYMRNRISAQSWASVPPAPDWMSTKQLAWSCSPENMRRNSSLPTRSAIFSTSPVIDSTIDSSSSISASSRYSSASDSPSSVPRISDTVLSRLARSLPSASALSGSFQISGLSSSRFTSSRRSTLLSKSKIPPERRHTLLQLGDAVADRIQFHKFQLKHQDNQPAIVAEPGLRRAPDDGSDTARRGARASRWSAVHTRRGCVPAAAGRHNRRTGWPRWPGWSQATPTAASDAAP